MFATSRVRRQIPKRVKDGHVKGVRFETLARICQYLDCQPGDLLEFIGDEAD